MQTSRGRGGGGVIVNFLSFLVVIRGKSAKIGG